MLLSSSKDIKMYNDVI